jgi:hypothetical protein
VDGAGRGGRRGTTSVNSTTTWMLGRWACRVQLDVSRLEGRGGGVGGGAAAGLGVGAGKETTQVWKMSQFMMPRRTLVRAQPAVMERGLVRGGQEPRRDFRGRCGSADEISGVGAETTHGWTGAVVKDAPSINGERGWARSACAAAQSWGQDTWVGEGHCGSRGAHRDARLGGWSRGGVVKPCVDIFNRVL